MKRERVHVSNLSFIAAFVIGVILFALFWDAWTGSATSAVILAGMAGVAVAVTGFWTWNKVKNRTLEDK